MELQIIYTETEMLLSKKQYGSWQEIQAEFSDYKTSLGPWPADAVIDYLQTDYPGLDPSPAMQVAELLKATVCCQELTFRKGRTLSDR
ncbi:MULTISPECIES: hypothetical protein [Cyanophyceae]|uniref:Uncharacterized protein n=1 Tax=Leptolyngbya subtilissima DQ-A4 TaxID=2933933 RepID=A0ABV0K0J8_9CYAN|nr:hypothetical protein [Nodosilinea sp. FACHB-141]